MASLTQWTWVWVDSWSWWLTGRPGVLRFMGSQSWTWLSNWTELRQENNGNSDNVIFLGSKITADGDYSHEIKRHLLLGRKATTKLDSILKSRDITLMTKVHLVKSMVFPVVMYRFRSWTIKKVWVPKNWCFWVVVLEKTPESPLDSKEIKTVYPKGNQLWIFIGRPGARAPIFWPPDVKSRLTGKDPDAGKDWRQEEKTMTETRWLDGITKAVNMSLSELQEML